MRQKRKERQSINGRNEPWSNKKEKKKMRKIGEENYQKNELILKNKKEKENKWKEIKRNISPVKK